MPTFSFRVFTIEPGGHTPFHNHPFEHLNYFIKVNGSVVVDHLEYEVKQGDFIMILTDEVHQCRNTSTDAPVEAW